MNSKKKMGKIKIITLTLVIIAVIFASAPATRAQTVESVNQLSLQAQYNSLQELYTSLLRELIKKLQERIIDLQAQLAALKVAQNNPPAVQSSSLPTVSPSTQPIAAPAPILAQDEYPVVKIWSNQLSVEVATKRRVEWVATQKNKNEMKCEASGDFAGKVGTGGVTIMTLTNPLKIYSITITCTDQMTLGQGSATLSIGLNQ